MGIREVSLFCVEALPLISAGADIADEVLSKLRRFGRPLEEGDIVVVAQKIVSKAEGREVSLTTITPGERAWELAASTGKDPRLVELILTESSSVLRAVTNTLIVEHQLGHIMANAGVDRSNLDADPQNEDIVLLLPKDPDDSAARLRSRFEQAYDVRIGVIISDSFGRPWRMGTTGVALGVSGVPGVIDKRGTPDLFGRPLQVTEVGFADSVAAAAVLAMGEGAEGCPVVIVRGLAWQESVQNSVNLLRPKSKDLFR